MLGRGGNLDDLFELMVWLGILLGVIALATVVVFLLRRWLLRPDDETVGGTFSLEQLRDLRDRGELTIPEYERLRRQSVGLPPPPSDTRDGGG